MTVSHTPHEDLSTTDKVDQMFDLLFGACDDGPAANDWDRFIERERRIVVISAVVKRASERQKIQLAWWSLAGHGAAKLAGYLSDVIGVLSTSRVQQLIEEGRILGGVPSRRKSRRSAAPAETVTEDS